jgi:hypothetical protein
MHGTPRRDWEEKPFTHNAFVFRTEGMRRGRRVGRWINEGVARSGPDGTMQVYLHSLPVGGFDGRLFLAPIGVEPPQKQPQRAGADGDDAEDSEG